MKRLSTKVYLAFVFVLLVFFLLTALIFWRAPHGARDRGVLQAASTVARMALPEDLSQRSDVEQRVAEIARALDGSASLYGPGGERIARSGDLLPSPLPGRDASHWLTPPHDRRAPAAALRLDGGGGNGDYWLVVTLPRRPGGPQSFFTLLAILLIAMGAGAYPLARGITSRIERLTDRVDALGRGELSARVEIAGEDEIARLATSFNHASQRIETLVASQRTLLASASHELRSPLARLRMGVELLADGAADPASSGEAERREDLRRRIVRDVDRLDAGVEELLVVSRLDLVATECREPVDLLAVAAEEAARFDLEAEGESATVRGDVRSLRHLVRNLLSNAERHAGSQDLSVRVERLEDEAVVEVLDRGPGIPADEREAIFQPFRRGRGRGGGNGDEGIGLGLAIVQEIALRHGGRVEALDREGGGSRFRASFPLARG